MATAGSAQPAAAAVAVEALDLDRPPATEFAGVPPFPARRVVLDSLIEGLREGAVAALLVAPLWAFSRARPLSRVYANVAITMPCAVATANIAVLVASSVNGSIDAAWVDREAARIARDQSLKNVNQNTVIAAGLGASYGAVFGSLAFRSVAASSATAVGLYYGARLVQRYIEAQNQPPPPPVAPAPELR